MPALFSLSVSLSSFLSLTPDHSIIALGEGEEKENEKWSRERQREMERRKEDCAPIRLCGPLLTFALAYSMIFYDNSFFVRVYVPKVVVSYTSEVLLNVFFIAVN